uniref:Calcineurin-like phosphoesterase superfamily domain-containing protein n=1 Tax=Trepomonas sp. PC1 TaxID=1076344 RepID=A0A146K3J4_9EUKA|eukprot:JAP91008.1 Calcineurin-like phosphoesterase superfamily domain-containing protein [Trepomonas sp. PC1]
MRILFITDIHEAELLFEKLGEFQQMRPDIIILGGDFQSQTTIDLQSAENQQKNTDFVLKVCDFLSQICPVKCILGNHDHQDQMHKYRFSEDFSFMGYRFLTQCGSSSTLPENTTQKENMNIGYTFWDGHPFGPRLDSEQWEEFERFQRDGYDHRTKEIENMKPGQFLDRDCTQTYNRNQDLGTLHEKVIVVTHQGPYCSATTCDVCYGLQFSSGSPQNQLFYERNKENIILWLHGHTHYPRYVQCEKIVNPGAFARGGNVALVDVADGQFTLLQ